MVEEKNKKPDKAEESIPAKRDGDFFEYIKESERREKKIEVSDTFAPPPRPDKSKEKD